MVGVTEFFCQTEPVRAKTPIFNRYSRVTS